MLSVSIVCRYLISFEYLAVHLKSKFNPTDNSQLTPIADDFRLMNFDFKCIVLYRAHEKLFVKLSMLDTVKNRIPLINFFQFESNGRTPDQLNKSLFLKMKKKKIHSNSSIAIISIVFNQS